MATLKAAVPRRYKQTVRGLLLRGALVANAGSRVECPCCGTRQRKFARFHGIHDQCPGCGALMRHRTLLLYLRDALFLPLREGRFLHVAPSRGVRRWLASLERLDYLAIDLDSPLADLHCDLTDLPLGDGEFDFVLCSHVLEHIVDDRAAIAELHRVLRPGGTAIVEVPPSDLDVTLEDAGVTTPGARERVFGQYDHVRICGADYGERLAEAGFQVAREDYVERLDAETRARYALRPGEPFYVCVKPEAAE